MQRLTYANKTLLANVIAGNMIPVAGILFFNWNLFGMLFLYISQQIIQGYFTFLKFTYLREDFSKGLKILSVPLGLIMFGALLFGLVMSLADILTPGKEITGILEPISNLMSQSPFYFLFSIFYYVTSELLIFFKNITTVSVSSADNLYFYSSQKFILVFALLVVFGAALDIFSLNFTLSIIILFLAKSSVDWYFAVRIKIYG